MIRKILISFLFSILVYSNAHADANPEPGIIDNILEIFKDIPKETDSPKITGKAQEPKFDLKDDKGNPVKIIGNIIFDGNSVVSDKDLREVAADYLDKPLTRHNLAKLKYEIKKTFFDKGYILVRVVTPPQHFANGKLIIYKVKKNAKGAAYKTAETVIIPESVDKNTLLAISIYEAEVGKITIKDSHNVLNSKITEAITSQVKKGDIVKESQLESMISDLNDLNDIKASLNLKPGAEFSTTDFDINIKSVNEDNNYISTNNYGSELTGKQMVLAHGEYSNLLNLGEKLTADIYKSEDELQGLRLGIATPTAIRNIQFEGSYLYSENEIGGRLASLKATGNTNKYTLALSSKLLNTRSKQNTIRFGYESRVHESFRNSIANKKDNIRKFYINNSYLQRNSRNTLYTSTTLSKGFDMFGSSSKGEDGSTITLGDQRAFLFKPLIINYYRPFKNKPHIVRLFAKGQLTSNTLLSSDLMSIGGYGSVRGFSASQESADKGYNFSLEYNHQLPIKSNKFKLKAGPFFDAGAVFTRVKSTPIDNHLYSLGFGLEVTAKVLPKNTKFRFDYAHPIGSYISDQISGETLYFSLRQDF